MPRNNDSDAAITHFNRVCGIDLFVTSPQLQRLALLMLVQFPALTYVRLHFDSYLNPVVPDPRPPVLPDGFLGGSAPHLRSLTLHYIPFPALSKLLLSATDLVHLTLLHIPNSEYMSPKTIVTSLAVLDNLKSLTVKFKLPQSYPNCETRHPSPTPFVLPALTCLEFQGVNRYLEDLVSWIDAPLLDTIQIFFVDHITFSIPQLAQFTERTTRFKASNETHVRFNCHGVWAKFLPPTPSIIKKSTLRFFCQRTNWRASISQYFRSLFPSIYMVKNLYISRPQFCGFGWQIPEENMQWLEIFRLFKAVTKLYVCKEFAQHFFPKLAGENVVNVLPSLESIFFLEERPWRPVQEAIERFVAARQPTGHPIAISHWDGVV